VLIANVSEPANLTLADLVGASDRPRISSFGLVGREFYSGRIAAPFTAEAPHPIAPLRTRPPSCATAGFAADYCVPFELWTFAPATSDFVFFGELDKFIGVSPQRFSELTVVRSAATPPLLRVLVHGSADETVTVGVADARTTDHHGAGTMQVQAFPVTLDATGTVTFWCGKQSGSHATSRPLCCANC
jgi:hypothetical protein